MHEYARQSCQTRCLQCLSLAFPTQKLHKAHQYTQENRYETIYRREVMYISLPPVNTASVQAFWQQKAHCDHAAPTGHLVSYPLPFPSARYVVSLILKQTTELSI